MELLQVFPDIYLYQSQAVGNGHARQGFLVRQGDFSLRLSDAEGGVRFSRKLVAAKVRWIEGEGEAKGIHPGSDSLPRHAVDEIHAGIVKSRSFCGRKRREGLTAIMPLLQELEDILVEGLDADVDAVNSQAPQCFEAGKINILRIHLHCDFCLGINGEFVCRPVQDGFQGFYRKHRRRATADVDGIESEKACPVNVHFSAEGIEEILCQVEVSCGIEAAIMAFAVTEGNMDVKAGRIHYFPPPLNPAKHRMYLN